MLSFIGTAVVVNKTINGCLNIKAPGHLNSNTKLVKAWGQPLKTFTKLI